MHFPSLVLLAGRAAAVLRRFPATLLVAVIASATAITASAHGADPWWARLALVAALGLPTTVALTLFAEVRGWSGGRRALVLAGAAAVLALFFAAWDGIETKHEAIRYFQLAAALHLTAAFLPFLGVRDSGSIAFWQYNRRLFIGFLRAVVFSGVLFGGIAVALGALDKLFGVHVHNETYFRLWLVVALVVNTWIFLAAVPDDLTALEHDAEYPRALKVFAQYILTPLAFTYLVILLAYLVKIVAGGEWPSGWVGWLVASVSVTGLLGWLLVHPLRADPEEGWIRIYTRWLFIGLIPAALMLLVAFWKRIAPYGLTEPRTLGFVLGVWLLGIAVLFAVKSNTGIRVIPITLAALLLLTLYGPVSLTRISIASQGRRFAAMLGAGRGARADAGEASAALRFLIEHRAAEEIAIQIGHALPPVDWRTMPRSGEAKDSLARHIMALAGATYVPAYARGMKEWFSLSRSDRSPTPVAGFDWMVVVSAGDTGVRMVGADSVSVLGAGASGVARVRTGVDTLTFDLRPLARRYADSMMKPGAVPAESLRLGATAGAGRWRGILAITALHGRREADSLRIDGWSGWLLLTTDSVETRVKRAAVPAPSAARR